MEKEFIPYTQALALKELEFNEPCLGYHNMVNHSGNYQFDIRIWEYSDDYVEAPLYSQAFRFFREKYVMCSFIQRFEGGVYDYKITSDTFKEITDFKDGYFKTYEEAELECLKKLIEIANTYE